MRTYLIVAVSVGIGCVIGSRLWTVPERMDAAGPAAAIVPESQVVAEVPPPSPKQEEAIVAAEPAGSTAEPAQPLETEPTAPLAAETVTPADPVTETSLVSPEDARQAVIQELKHFENALFPPVGEVVFVGTGDDGFDNYRYQSENAHVYQWKKGEDLFVEQIEFPNGDRVVRRSDLDESLQPSVTLTRPDGTGGGIYFNARREVESFTYREKDRSTAYFYDENGNVKDAYTFQ